MTTLQITRPGEWQNRFRKYHVYIDNDKAGELFNGETKDFILPEGRHTVVVKIDWCSSPAYTFDLKDGEIQYLKAGGNKMMQWASMIVLPILLFTSLFKNVLWADYLLLLPIPLLLFVIYMLTFGRRKYLRLEPF